MAPSEPEFSEIIITKTTDAPRTRVFDAWITPADLVEWFHASPGWTTPYAEIDARSGGAFKIGFKSPDGTHDFDFAGIYNDVAPPERLVFTIGDGRPVVVHLTEHPAGTEIALKLALESSNSAEQQRQGWSAMLDNLVSYLRRK